MISTRGVRSRRGGSAGLALGAVTSLVVSLVLGTLVMGVGPARAADGPSAVPIAGSFDFTLSRDAAQGTAVGVVNAVRRVPGGTVVYYSFGLRQGAQPYAPSPNSLGQVTIGGSYRASDEAYVDVVDPVGLHRYRPMVAGSTCLCSAYADLPQPIKPGVLYSGYVVVPPLPDSVTSVAVVGFFGAVVSNVPVEDGLLTPVTPDGKSVSMLTQGWPAVPTDQIAQVGSPDKFVLPLAARSANLDNSERTSETPTKVDVDLASDVLFAVDKSNLTDAAKSRIADVAADIAKRGTGTVTITGYTDSTGSPSHNQVLSDARAHSVLTALKAAAHKSGVTFTAFGRGESNPVASNATDAGRRLNRRVTISYGVTPGSGSGG